MTNEQKPLSPSVDPEEAEFFRRLAASWWDLDGPFWPLHRLNGLRTSYLRDHLCRHFRFEPNEASPLRGLRLLDVGCGGGILSEAMAALGAQVHGIDVVDRNIGVARTHGDDAGLDVRYEAATAEQLAANGPEYDAVLNMEVVEHVADLESFMGACCRLVRPGGLIFVATINRTLLSYLFAIVGAEYVLRWLPRGTHRWARFRRPGELEDLLRAGGFQVRGRRGVRVNPITRRFFLTPFLGVNYMLVAAKTPSSEADIGPVDRAPQ